MPSSARRRQILEQVARGELSPDAAAELLALDPDHSSLHDAAGPAPNPAPTFEPGPTSAPGPTPEPEPASHTDPHADPGADAAITAIHIRSACRAVSVIGDADVRTAVAEGDHTARVEGGVMTIEAHLESTSGFSFIRAGGFPGRQSRARIRIGDAVRPLNVRPLVVRMNPALRLQSHVDAGSVTVSGVHGPIAAHASAGAVRIDDFQSPITIKVAAGSATARGRITGGASRIECDAGKVSGHVTLGQLSAPDSIGDGAGTLDIVANLGAVDIAVDDFDADDFDAGDRDADGRGHEAGHPE
jgi:hypothetical protein